MTNKSPIKRRLGVNIDHIATLREARKVVYPSPFEALTILKECSVDQVTIHLREDRRHIQDDDLNKIVKANILPVNLELAVTDEMVEIAAHEMPHTATFVPEKREEVTTEGGLDCVKNFDKVKKAVSALQKKGIRCSLFIDPDVEQVKASQEINAEAVEIHTGAYCNIIEDYFAKTQSYDYFNDKVFLEKVNVELSRIKESCTQCVNLGLKAFAGHGLHTHNLKPVTEILEIEEYNIGHSIIARSVFVGLKRAVEEVLEVLK